MSWDYYRGGEARHDLNQRVWALRDRARRTFYYRPSLCPWVVASRGTDCDGMRWDNVWRHWTRRAALAEVQHQSDWADGPTYSVVVFAWSKQGRRLRRDGVGWADGIDRYAEADGY